MDGATRIVTIAITIMLALATLTILMTGVTAGQSLADTWLESYNKTENVAQLSALKAFEESEGEYVPLATIYALLKKNPNVVLNLKCNICGKETIGDEAGECFRNHMHGRAKYTVTYYKSSSNAFVPVGGLTDLKFDENEFGLVVAR